MALWHETGSDIYRYGRETRRERRIVGDETRDVAIYATYRSVESSGNSEDPSVGTGSSGTLSAVTDLSHAPLAQHNHEIETLTTSGSDEAFAEGVCYGQ